MSDSRIDGMLLTLWKPLIGIGFGVMGRYSVRFFCDCLPESFFVASKMLERPLSSTERRLFSFNGFGGRVGGGGACFVGATDVIVSVVVAVSEFDTSVGFSFSKESDSKFWNCGSFISRVGIFGSGLNMIGTGGIFRTGKLKSGFSM
uniref:Uncharacterized protein n=1 Tax=Anopheles melas TaxID=34690 RepID=A0A182TQH6_9DIPT